MNPGFAEIVETVSRATGEPRKRVRVSYREDEGGPWEVAIYYTNSNSRTGQTSSVEGYGTDPEKAVRDAVVSYIHTVAAGRVHNKLPADLPPSEFGCDHRGYFLIEHPEGGERPYCPACRDFVDL